MLFAAAALLALPFLASAQPSPDTPTAVAEGAECTISWKVDPTGTWTNMAIEFMTGNNQKMTHMSTLTTLDGTKETSYTWTCPSVTPNSKIYFYQLSSPTAPTALQWSSRFAITAADGSTTEPESTTSDGVGFGNGAFVDTSLYNAPPTYLLTNGQLIGGASNSTAPGSSGSATSAAAVTSASSVATTSVSAAVTTTASGAANTASGSAPSKAESTGSKVSTSVTRAATSSAATGTSTGTSGQATNGGAIATSGTSWIVLTCATLFGAVAVSL